MALKKCKECGHRISKKSENCINCGNPNKNKISIWGTIKWLLALLTLVFVYQCTKGINQAQREINESNNKISEAINNIQLEYTWGTPATKLVMEASFTITNNNSFSVKDIEIKCTHYAKSGTRIDSNKHTIYQKFPPIASRSFANVNMGFIHSQANKSACVITNLAI